MKFLFTLAILAAGFATAATAADKPDFSGDWKMNAAKSDYGQVPAPATFIRKITHTEPTLTIEDTQTGTALGDQHDTRTYTTDGKEISYQSNGADLKSSATWEGQNIQIDTKASIQGMDLVIKDKLALAEDGKTLTDAVHITTPMGDLDLKVVFEKQ